MKAPKDAISRIWQGPLQTPARTPPSADIVVIGGGIVGVATAWFLARQGVDVVLCEKGYIAGEQSGRNWGWVRQMGRDRREMSMMTASMRTWAGLATEIGEDVGFTRGGCLFLARTPAQLDKDAEWLGIAREFELDTRVVTGAELDALVENGSKHWVGALYTASDARAEPHKATPAIARAAARAGAKILTGCAVRGIDTGSGRVSAVVTEHGIIRTSTVLCAAGAWTSMFCHSLGISIPQLNLSSTVARLGAGPSVLDGNAFDEQLGIRRRQDGGYTVAYGFLLSHSITPSSFRFGHKFMPAYRVESGKLRFSLGKEFLHELLTPTRWAMDRPSPFEKRRVLDPAPNPSVLRKTRQQVDRLFPQLSQTAIVESWAGMVEATPDAVPVMCEIDKLPGFFVATGFSGHGFGIGPGAGEAAAAMMTGNACGIDISQLHRARLFDGSPITPHRSV